MGLHFKFHDSMGGAYSKGMLSRGGVAYSRIYRMFVFILFNSVECDNEPAQFVTTVLSLLREVETEIPNIRQDRERCEFYANRVLSAMQHLACIIVYMQHTNGHPPDQVQELQTLRDNLKAI